MAQPTETKQRVLAGFTDQAAALEAAADRRTLVRYWGYDSLTDWFETRARTFKRYRLDPPSRPAWLDGTSLGTATQPRPAPDPAPSAPALPVADVPRPTERQAAYLRSQQRKRSLVPTDDRTILGMTLPEYRLVLNRLMRMRP